MNDLSAAALALALSSFASAAGQLPQPPDNTGVIAVPAIDAVATVIQSDLALRTVTIKDPKGRKVMIDIPPEVAVGRILVGSLLDVRYLEAEALAIGRPGGPAMDEVQTVMIVPNGGRPGALTTKTKRLTGLVQEIDRRRREVILLGPDHDSILLKVAHVIAGFDEMKVGDTAVVQYIGALALSAVMHEEDKENAKRL